MEARGTATERRGDKGRSEARFAEVLRLVANARDMATLRRTVMGCARELFEADGATFVLRDDDHCHYIDEDAILPLWKGKRFPVDACVSGWAMLERDVALVDDAAKDSRIPWLVYEPTFVRSLAMAPMRLDDPLGALGIYWSETGRAHPVQAPMLQCLADMAAGVLENLRLIEELERRERLYSSILQDQTEMIVRWRPGGERTFVNDAYRKTFSRDGDPLEGTSFFPELAEEDRAAVEAKIANLTRAHPVAVDVRRVRRADGSIAWQEWTDRALCDADGKLLEYQSVGRDITERVRLESQLAWARTHESISQLAAGVVHDLNNLLTPVELVTELLRARLRDDARGLALLDEVGAVTEAMQELMGRLLSLCRDPAQPELRRVDLVATIEEQLPLVRSVVGKEIEVRFEARARPRVQANAGLISQLLLNLAGNARDAQPNDQFRITVDETVGDGGNGEPPPRWARIVCADRGPGMPPEVAARVFDPYFTTKGERGTGLGLSTVHLIAKNLGGSVDVRTQPGVETAFEVRIPLA